MLSIKTRTGRLTKLRSAGCLDHDSTVGRIGSRIFASARLRISCQLGVTVCSDQGEISFSIHKHVDIWTAISSLLKVLLNPLLGSHICKSAFDYFTSAFLAMFANWSRLYWQ